MIQTKFQNHWTLEISQEHFLAIAIESFLTDHRTTYLTKSTVEYYSYRHQCFERYCENQAVRYIHEINTDFLRYYILTLGKLEGTCCPLEFDAML